MTSPVDPTAPISNAFPLERGGYPSASRPTLGSLCTGYGGLDLAIEHVLGTRTKWLCEYEAAPTEVCEARFSGVPNLHDLTVLDWEQVPPVDVLTAGYPCQPFSSAGRRQGVNDARHLWPYIAECLRVLRPRLAIFENVAGHVSLGLDVVLGDLASLGFDAEWLVVRASAVGACHQRERLFILAADASRAGAGRDARPVPRTATPSRRAGADVHAPLDAREDTPDADGERRQERLQRHGDEEGPIVEPSRGDDVDGLVEALADPSGGGWGRPGSVGGEVRAGHRSGSRPEPGRHDAGGVAWGDYEAAIRRHEHALGRPVPVPTDDRGRLNPRFVEWMMMLPEGWVTDVLTSRTKALKCLGNGVVPPQAEFAVNHLLARLNERLVAA